MSFYLTEKKALFLHVPRTGGTWVKEAMHLAGIPMQKWGVVGEGDYRQRKHTMIPHLRKDLWMKVNVVFAFVRPPVPYYVSVWRFTTRAWNIWPEMMQRAYVDRGDSSAVNEAARRWKPNFGDWLEEMIEEEPGWATRWFERYLGPPGAEFCHFIGRTETVQQDLESVLRKFGYGDRWDENLKSIKRIKHAKNKVRAVKAPPVFPTDEQIAKIERSERVLLKRFYGENENKRFYRDFETGEPL